MKNEAVLKRLAALIEDMGFDYDRFSKAGKETYAEILLLLETLKL